MTEQFNLKPGEEYSFIVENKIIGTTFKKDDIVYYDLDFNQYVIKTDNGLVIYNNDDMCELDDLKFIFEDDTAAFFDSEYGIYVYNKSTKIVYEFSEMVFQYEKYLRN